MGSCVSKKQKSNFFPTESARRSRELEIREKKNQIFKDKILNCPQLQLHTNLKYLQRILQKCDEKTMFSFSDN